MAETPITTRTTKSELLVRHTRSMLHEFGSRSGSGSYKAQALMAGGNYGRVGGYVLHHHSCYPTELGENPFNLGWDQQPLPTYHSSSYHHQTSLHANPEAVAGFFNSVAGGSFLSRPGLATVHHHLRHPHVGHAQFGGGGKQVVSGSSSGQHGGGGGGGGGVANGSGSAGGGHKLKPRRRVASVSQRRAANIRERRRMYSLNTEFDRLRKKVPTFAYEKKLSRIETLRLAITYISFMKEVLQDGSRENEMMVHGSYGNPSQNAELGPLCNEILWSAKPELN